MLQVLMGIFYYVRSVALVEDLPMGEAEEIKDINEFYAQADRGYSQVWLYGHIFQENSK